MSDENPSSSASSTTFTKGFLLGLLVGIVVGGFAGAFLPPLLEGNRMPMRDTGVKGGVNPPKVTSYL